MVLSFVTLLQSGLPSPPKKNAHRGDLEQGPNGDLRSILFKLIDERSGVTDFIKVKSHLENAGPSVIK